MCNFIHLSSSLTYLRSNLRYFLSTVRETFDLIQSSLLHFTFWQSISNSLCSDNCILSNISFMRTLLNSCCRKCLLQKGTNFAMMDFSSIIMRIYVGSIPIKIYDQVTIYLETMIFFLKKLLWDPRKVKFRHLWLRWS